MNDDKLLSFEVDAGNSSKIRRTKKKQQDRYTHLRKTYAYKEDLKEVLA